MKCVLQVAGATLLLAVVVRWTCLHVAQQDTYPTDLNEEQVVGHVPRRPELDDFLADGKWDQPKQFMKVTDGVWVAMNYALGYVIILEGPDGLIIVDTTESRTAAREIKQQIRAVTSKTIAAIVYTHCHLDHIQGTEEFIEDALNPPDIWAHETFPAACRAGLLPAARYLRGVVHQFGTALGKYRAWPPPTVTVQPARPPNKFVQHQVNTVNLAGLNVTFLHIPGESDDEMALWLADRRILLPADDIYKAFPNLYAIRGTQTRDVMVWADSVRRMRDLEADFLIMQHSYPITGRQNIYEILTAYISAIQYVHDQTVRQLNKLQHPDDIARLVQLPPSLARHPFLKEMYGRVDWAAKSVYQRYVGWFSGDPADLGPLSPGERARRLVDVIGIDRLLSEASTSLMSSDPQWSLELCSYVLKVDPNNVQARRLRLESLRALAAVQTNPSARNYYLTAALDDHQLINWKVDRSEQLKLINIKTLLDVMKVKLKAEVTDGLNLTVYLNFEDTRQIFKLQIRYSVLTVDRVSEIPAAALRHRHTTTTTGSTGNTGTTGTTGSGDGWMVLTTTELVWKQVLVGQLEPAVAFTDGTIQLTVGHINTFKQFITCFDTE